MPEHFKPRELNVESPYVLSMVVSKHNWKGWEVTQEERPQPGKRIKDHTGAEEDRRTQRGQLPSRCPRRSPFHASCPSSSDSRQR